MVLQGCFKGAIDDGIPSASAMCITVFVPSTVPFMSLLTIAVARSKVANSVIGRLKAYEVLRMMQDNS